MHRALFASLLVLASPLLAQKPVSAELQPAEAAMKKGDFPAALKLLLAEAEKGNVVAENLAGEMIFSGRGTAASSEEAARWFEKAANAGDAQAQLNLGRLLNAGAGVKQDAERARFLIQQAAESGHAPAQVDFARLLEAGVDLYHRTPDWREPRAWLEKAAAQHDAEALYALVRYYDEGRSGDIDKVKATALCIQAAQAGSALAMNEMGVRYQKGTGISSDNVAAIGWFSIAAQHGAPAAYVNLGNCYETGNGAMLDYNKAGENYTAGVRLGLAPAALLLGGLFESGKGTAPDPVKALSLYIRAAKTLPEAAKRRDALREKLTPAQIAEAEKIVAADAKTK